jgi:hypothetical protein
MFDLWLLASLDHTCHFLVNPHAARGATSDENGTGGG